KLVEDHAAYGSFYQLVLQLAFAVARRGFYLDVRVQVHAAFVVGYDHRFRRLEVFAFTLYFYLLGRFPAFGDVVQAQHHVLGRQRNGRTVLRVQDVVGGQHQQLGFQYGGIAQGHVHGHLVTVKVSVEGATYQRVQLDGLTFHQLGLECLDRQTVQRGGTVQHDRVAFQHIFQDVPHHGFFPVYQLFSGFNGLYNASFYQLADNERFEQLCRHVFGEAAFMQLQLGTYHDHGTAGVVHTLTQQVLTETALLALQHIGEGFQGAAAFCLHRVGFAGVIEQGVHGFLQHTFFVTQDHLGRLDLYQAFQAVVADDHPAVQVVEVRGRKTAAVQGHQRAQLRRNYGNILHHQPFGTVLYAGIGSTEGFHHAQALQGFCLGRLGGFGSSLVAQLVGKAVQVYAGQHYFHCFGAHAGN